MEMEAHKYFEFEIQCYQKSTIYIENGRIVQKNVKYNRVWVHPGVVLFK